MNNNRLGRLRGSLAAAVFLGATISFNGASAQQSSGENENLAAEMEAVSQMAGPRPEITFTSWTGPYMRSQMLGFVRPYEEETGSAGQRRAVTPAASTKFAIRSNRPTSLWDVVDLTQADSLRACKEGLLEDLSGVDLPDGADGSELSSDDFVEGALNPCGVGVIVWATAFAYTREML